MSGQHTPGPWAAESQSSGSGWVSIIAANTYRLPVGYATPADCGEPHERRDDETKANARLIAAAPELLSACERLVASLAEHDDEGMIEHAEQMISARAAIAATTGVHA